MSTKRRMPASSGYIGAGNRSSVFNRKPKVAFEKIKSLYDVEISKDGHSVKSSQKISAEERNLIKLKVKKQIKIQLYWELFFGIIALLLTIAIFYWLMKYVK